MTCGTCNETVKSVGTIRVDLSTDQKIYFSPNAEHSASGNGKHYAVFLPDGGCTNGVAIPFCDPLRGLPIKLGCSPKLSDLVAAAAQQTAVEVKVKAKVTKKAENLTLESIVIPGPRTKR